MNQDPDLIEISDQSRLAEQPLVSILMIVFNHADYLAQAIDGLVCQKCDFPYEIVIGEDASTDASLDIALSYQKKYPHLIRVLYAESNVGMNANSRRVRSAAKGEFLAWCEGDDYWCASDKLARQAALLIENPSMGAVHTDWVKSRMHQGQWTIDWESNVHRNIPRQSLEGNLFYCFFSPRILRTCTLMFRKCISENIDTSELGKNDYRFCDTVTAIFITENWSIGYLPIVTAVYRESPNSVLRSGIKARISFLRSALDFDLAARSHFGHRKDYPDAFRFETRVGLILWAARGLLWRDLYQSSADFIKECVSYRSVHAGLQALRIRFPPRTTR